MLEKQALSIIVKGMDEKQFLTYVAKAAGGFLQDTPKAYRMELDGEQFRKRAVNMLILRLDNDSSLNNEYEFETSKGPTDILIGIFRAAPAGVIAAAFKSPDSHATTDLTIGSEAAKAWVTVMKRPNPDGRSKMDPKTGTVRTPMGEMSFGPNTLLKVTLDASFGAKFMLTFPMPDGAPGTMTMDLR